MIDALEPTPPPKEPQIEIHKPKAVHSWREFLKEYAIIVLGVATALAAEQAVEWWHWQGEVQAARGALRAEMSAITNYYGRRVAIASCVDHKLDTVAALLAHAAAGQQPDTGSINFTGLGAPLYDSEWQSERASQALTHFPRQELAVMSAFYGQATDMHDWNLEEARAWTGLAVLQDAAQKLGPADLAQLRQSYHLARRFQNAIVLNAGRQIAVAAQLGLQPAALTPAQIANSCNSVSERAKF